MRKYAYCLALLLAACGSDASEGAGTDGTDTDAGTDTDNASATSTTGLPESCEGVDCGGKGMCSMTDDGPVCLCDDGTFDNSAPLDCDTGSASASASGSSTTGDTSDSGTASGSSSDGTGGSATTTDGTGGSSTTTDGTGGSSTTTGGGKGDGEPCDANDECQSGFCYGQTMGFPGPTPPEPECQSECIGGFDFSSVCDDDGDCCQGTCEDSFQGPTCQN